MMTMEDTLNSLCVSFMVDCLNFINIRYNTSSIISMRGNFNIQDFDNMLPATIEKPMVGVIEYDIETMHVYVYHALKITM